MLPNPEEKCYSTAVWCLAVLKYRDSCRTACTNLNILQVVALSVQEDIPSFNLKHSAKVSIDTTWKMLYISPYHFINSSRSARNHPSDPGAKLFNLLPGDIKNTDPEQFRKQLTSWQLKRPFSSLDQFLQGEYSRLSAKTEIRNCDTLIVSRIF